MAIRGGHHVPMVSCKGLSRGLKSARGLSPKNGRVGGELAQEVSIRPGVPYGSWPPFAADGGRRWRRSSALAQRVDARSSRRRSTLDAKDEVAFSAAVDALRAAAHRREERAEMATAVFSRAAPISSGSPRGGLQRGSLDHGRVEILGVLRRNAGHRAAAVIGSEFELLSLVARRASRSRRRKRIGVAGRRKVGPTKSKNSSRLVNGGNPEWPIGESPVLTAGSMA